MRALPNVLREASTYLLGLTVAALLQFLAVPILTRYLGPSQYSVLALVLAVTTSITGVLLIGGDVALTRFWFATQAGEERRRLTTTWIGFLTGWSLIPVALACLVSPLISERLSPDSPIASLLVIGFVILIPTQLSRMLAQILRNSFRPWPFALTSVAIAGMALVFGLTGAVILGLGVLGVLLGTLTAESIGVLIRGFLARRELRARPAKRLLRRPLLFGVPFVPASIAFWVFTGMDRIVVSSVLDASDLGAYSVAAMLVAPFSILLTALGQAWFPRITQDYEEDQSRAARLTGLALEASLIFYGLGALVVGAAAPWLIGLIAGPGYEAGSSALPLLALGSVFLGVSLFTSTGLTLARKTAWAPVVTVSAAALDIALLLVLVPSFGLVGAGFAVAAAFFTLSAGSFVISQTYFPIPVRWLTLSCILAMLLLVSLLQSARPAEPSTLMASFGAALVLVITGVRRVLPARQHQPADDGQRHPQGQDGSVAAAASAAREDGVPFIATPTPKDEDVAE